MIAVRIWEGLGNQLFQYAYARALELRTGQKVYLDISEYEMKPQPIREYELCHFRIRQPVIHCAKVLPFVNRDKYYAKDMRRLKYFPVGLVKEDDCYFKQELCALNGLLYIKGWFQSEKYFKEFTHSIREELYPRNKISISRKLKRILEFDNTVSVHIRRGDFKKYRNILSDEYYEKAKEMISRLIGEPYFIIFSDDIPYVKENMNFEPKCFYVEPKYLYKDYEELMIMSRCKHNIIANSTFSWWGAWLNCNENKIVIAPKKWFPDKLEKDVNIVPDEWLRV